VCVCVCGLVQLIVCAICKIVRKIGVRKEAEEERRAERCCLLNWFQVQLNKCQNQYGKTLNIYLFNIDYDTTTMLTKCVIKTILTCVRDRRRERGRERAKESG